MQQRFHQDCITHTPGKYVKDGSVSHGNDSSLDRQRTTSNCFVHRRNELSNMVSAVVNIAAGSGADYHILHCLEPLLNSLLESKVKLAPWEIQDTLLMKRQVNIRKISDQIPSGTGEKMVVVDTVGHLVLVNDTQISKGHGWALNPDVNVDEDGNIHIVWIDGRGEFLPKTWAISHRTTCNSIPGRRSKGN